MSTRTLDTFITMRVPTPLRDQVHERAQRYGKTSDVLREILEAFVEDRLVIKKPVKETLYDN